MNRAVLLLTIIVCSFGCDEAKKNGGEELHFDNIRLPTADSPYTYHGPGGQAVILIDKDDNLRLETTAGEVYVNPSHDSAADALKFQPHHNRKQRVHIFLDKRATFEPIRRAYSMIEAGEVEYYLVAAELGSLTKRGEYRSRHAMSFTVPSKEIRSRLKLPNP